MARPTKLDTDMHNTITEALSAGATIAATCANVNIGESTYFSWLERGEKELKRREGKRVREGTREWVREQTFVEFLEAVTRAKASGLVQAAAKFRAGFEEYERVTITKETVTETRLDKDGKPYEYTKTVEKEVTVYEPGDWRAAMEYLARRDPDNWARQRIDVRHSGDKDNPVEVKAYIGFSPDDWDDDDSD
ncbi:MAG: hypothetical protein ACPG7F_11470 [Aggregatilineales bacterium]